MENDKVAHEFSYFPLLVYTDTASQFLDIVKIVAKENLDKVRKQKELDEIYPVYMTGNMFNDPRMADFCSYVGESA